MDEISFIEILGLSASFLNSIAELPQVVKSWKTKSAKDVSIRSLFLYCTAETLWTIYGFSRQDLPVLLSGISALILNLTLVFLKFKYK